MTPGNTNLQHFKDSFNLENLIHVLKDFPVVEILSLQIENLTLKILVRQLECQIFTN